MKIIKENIKPFFISSFLVGGGGFSYLYYIAQKNYDEHHEMLRNSQQLKDTTRPQYEYFGINWGYQADAIVHKKLDTGDLLFMKFDCMSCTSLKELVQFLKRCQINNFLKPYPHYDSLGLVYRDEEGVHILYNRLGTIQISNYVQCLCEPFWDHLSVRQLRLQQSKKIQKSIGQWFSSIKEGNCRIDNDKLLAEILKKLDVVNPNYQNLLDLDIQDIDKQKPKIFKNDVQLGTSIVIRSKTNKKLQG